MWSLWRGGVVCVGVCAVVGCASAPPPVEERPAQEAPKEEAPPVSPPVVEEPAPPPLDEPPAPAALRFEEARVQVGKWPEGVALVGDTAWVAESGARQLARVELGKGAVAGRVGVGRLPVQLASGEAGEVFALVHTDKVVMQVGAGRARGKALARLPDCPTSMRAGEGALFVLLWDACASGGGTVVRVDPKRGKQQRSADLGANLGDVAAGHGRVWVGARDRVVVLDAQTLASTAAVEIPGYGQHILSGPQGVYVDAIGGVVRLDPAQPSQLTRVEGIGQVAAMTLLPGGEVAALNRAGELAVLDPVTLEIRGTFTPSAPFEPRDVIARPDGTLLITAHAGEQGDLWMWTPRTP
jgi:hypothetical protein